MYDNKNYNRNEYNRSYNYGNHIQDPDMYRQAVRNLKWTNRKGNGERWNMDDIIKRSDIDFNQEDFTPYDYAYMVNARYADYGDISEKPDYYMQMAKYDLHNDSFPERGNERAYYDAQRRSRRYNYDNRYENRYENRYDGYSERNSYRDRDNDGRYNE